MVAFGGLNVEQLETKFISMGCDGNNVFHGVWGWHLYTNEKECGSIFYENTLFCSLNQSGCVGFIKVEFVVQLEALLHVLCEFLFHSPKKFIEF